MSSSDNRVFWSDEQYEIRPAKNNDEFRDVWWSFMQSLGWNRGYYDLDTYMEPSFGCGMILLVEKSTGHPVGHVAAIINPNSTGWVSMFIVDEKHRGKGLGAQLFNAAEKDLERHGTRYIGLDGVVEQRRTYERRRFVSSSMGGIKIMVRNLYAKSPFPEPDSDVSIIDIRKVPKELLAQHELQYTGFQRPALWHDGQIFARKDVQGVAVVANSDLKDVGDLLAWAVARRCSGGVRLGPLYASDVASAKAALLAAMKLATPAFIKDVPLPGEAMNDWSEDKIANEATLVIEVSAGNADALALFDEIGWQDSGIMYHRMWVEARAPPEQREGGSAQRGIFAIFDAAVG